MRLTPVRGLHQYLALRLVVVVACAAAAAAAPALAQEAPAHVTAVDGAAWIDGRVDTINATAGEVVMAGDRIRTAAGRVEIWFADGTAFALDYESELELQSATLFRLTSGRLWLTVPRSASSLQPAPRQIDTPIGSVFVREPGEYRVELLNDGRDPVVDVVALRGTAELTTDAGAVLVRSGEQTTARLEGPPGRPMRFNTARRDAFDNWAAGHGDIARGRATSSQYLPDDLRMYAGSFDQYGSWDYEPSDGYVWYPAVDPGWRPYYNGYWRALPTYGWTWIGLDPWGWPTHHYGRWGYARARWYWIPERHWAPAWVGWASAPSYVSWCPLGFDSRPVFGFSLSYGSTWAGWTVMSRADFGRIRVPVARYAVEGRRLPRSVPFAMHASAPLLPPSVRNGPGGTAASGWTTQRDDRRPRALPRAGYAGGQRSSPIDRAVPAETDRNGLAAREPGVRAGAAGQNDQAPRARARSAPPVTTDNGIRAFRRDRIPMPETTSSGSGQMPTSSAPGQRPSGIARGVQRVPQPAQQADPSPRVDRWRVYEQPTRRHPGATQTARDAGAPTAPQADRSSRSSARDMAPHPPSRPQAVPHVESRGEASGPSQRSNSHNGSSTSAGNGGGGGHRRRP